MRRWPQQQHWRGNSIILPTCSTGFNNRSIGKATESTTLHTATALVVNLPVKVKARTSNGYVQNVTRCPLKHNKICKICFKNSKS
jgi:hypothetical protein